ncbi:MAG: type II toxin-antitoxin system RelB/DinJ family antitoxin [Legionella sp.]|nr:type II toxin-antitoxin system RelB/DinJ family antitoxin [Legionella sp.]
MKTATVRARVEPELKVSVEGVLTELGLSVSEAIELYMHQIELHQGIPFAIRIPNAKTKKTFEDTDKGKNLTYYDSADEMFKQLGIDDDKD